MPNEQSNSPASGTLGSAPEDFTHPSRIHGQGQVARVIVQSLVLVDARAAANVQGLGRGHDGVCQDLGQHARYTATVGGREEGVQMFHKSVAEPANKKPSTVEDAENASDNADEPKMNLQGIRLNKSWSGILTR